MTTFAKETRAAARSPSPVRRAPTPAPNPGPHSFQRSGAAPCACGGSCPRCAADRDTSKPSLGAWANALSHAPETKPADAAERSAEHAADAAVRDEPLSFASAAASAADIGTPPWGSGRRLSRDERQWHEPRAGAGLGEVRVHEGAVPARWARMLGARAFTIGRDVVMGAGEYASGTDAGRRLMAHELSHVAAARTPVLARVALSAADFTFLADSLHNAITTAKADEELIYVALQKLERDAAAIKSLKDAYKKGYKTALLTDLAARLKGNALGLAKTLLGEKKGLALATKPATPAEFEALAGKINTAIGAKPVDAESIYALLFPLAQDAGQNATMKTSYKTKFKTDLEADLATALAGTDLSYALYLLNVPAPAKDNTPPKYVAQPGPGDAAAKAPPPAPGGTVKAETKVPWERKSPDPAKPNDTGTFGFGVGYTGALAPETRWLQFIEREIDYDPKGGGKRTALDKEIESTSGAGKLKYRLTTVTNKPNWTVDSSDRDNPFFDETHKRTSWRDATSVSTYDAPAARETEMSELSTAGHTNITSRAHFETYLIRDFAPIYHVEVEITWAYMGPEKYKMTRTVKDAAAANSLPPDLKTALTSRYPAFAYIQ